MKLHLYSSGYMHYCPEANKVNIAKFEWFFREQFLI